MNERVRTVLGGILERFASGDIPEAIALASYPVADIPSARWSFLNRTIMFFSGTSDARGIRQWNQVNRSVRKGAKSFYILVPCMYKRKEADEEDKVILAGFKTGPVFRYEDTEGVELDYRQIEAPHLPLMERAQEWGISIKAIPGNYRYSGYYSSSRKEIALATPEEVVFFHELAHASHERVTENLKAGQDPLQEIIAELSAQALCRLAGKSTRDTMGNTYQYIDGYAQKINMSAYSACVHVLQETEQVLNLILKGGEEVCAEIATAHG